MLQLQQAWSPLEKGLPLEPKSQRLSVQVSFKGKKSVTCIETSRNPQQNV